MRRLFAAVLALCLLTALLAGCGAAPAAPTSDRLRIVCTIFPAWDWTREILGDHAAEAELTLLLDDGVDPHSYQPTADDMIRVSAADLFVYVGGESERWVADALKNAVNPGMRTVDLMATLGAAVRPEELTEGMQAEADEGGEAEMDEHVWLSLRFARTLCAAICEQLCALDAENAADYRANCAAYAEQLDALDLAYRQTVDAAPLRALVFGDRFPFRYLAEDYGLTCYAAFPGCSAETEASFETILFLAGRVDALGVPCVLKIEGAQHRIAETIVENTAARSQRILVLDSMQSTGAADAAGTTYLSVMENDLAVLRFALGGTEE